jgi:hypothetical protein
MVHVDFAHTVSVVVVIASKVLGGHGHFDQAPLAPVRVRVNRPVLHAAPVVYAIVLIEVGLNLLCCDVIARAWGKSPEL